MFGLGIWEVVVILTVALIVLGPRKLPEVARQIGKAMREFRRASNELRYNLDEAVTPREPPVRLDGYAADKPPTETTRSPTSLEQPVSGAGGATTSPTPAGAPPVGEADGDATPPRPEKPDAPAE